MISHSRLKPEQYSGDLIIFLVKQPSKGHPDCDYNKAREMIRRANEAGDFSGKDGQTLLFYLEPENNNPKRCMIVGLGKKKINRETIRRAGGTICKTTLQTKAKKMMVVAPLLEELGDDEVMECLTEGLILGAYQFLKHKSKSNTNDDKVGKIKEIKVYAESSTASKGFKRGKIAAEAACSCRDMANEPANHWTADQFAEYGRSIASQNNLPCTILSKEDMQRLGMNGILSVNDGSAIPSKLITLEYHTGNKVPKVLLVGKGLTFDSGGLSLKPREGMHEMKYDMCGGAAVLAVMDAIGKEKPQNADVIGIVPATDNLLGPTSLKPGDVITMYDGQTVEVVNTDAEGRLILADAIAYGLKKFKPDLIIDIATLTGAVIIGLGHHYSGLISNEHKYTNKLIKAGERSGEPMWKLPLGEEYTKQLKSGVADLKNIGGRAGGTITAAAFLQQFVENTKWIHLDIAGTAWDFTPKSYIPKGASGIGVRTLLEFIRSM